MRGFSQSNPTRVMGRADPATVGRATLVSKPGHVAASAEAVCWLRPRSSQPEKQLAVAPEIKMSKAVK